MARFRLTDHEADLGLEAEGATVEELFSEAARGLTACHTDLDSVRPLEVRTVEALADDRVELLVRWLKEWLYLQNGEGFLVCRVRVRELSEDRAVGEGWGEIRDTVRHVPEREVKAVTYHQARVEERDGCWRARVILDV